MQAQVIQSDQSLTIQIPQSLASEIGLHDGMSLELRVIDGHLALIPVIQNYDLEILLQPNYPRKTYMRLLRLARLSVKSFGKQKWPIYPIEVIWSG